MLNTVRNVHFASRTAASSIDNLSSEKKFPVRATLVKGQEYELAIKTYEHEQVLKKEETAVSKIVLYIGEFICWRISPRTNSDDKNYLTSFSSLSKNLSTIKPKDIILKKDIKTVKKELIRLEEELNPKDREPKKRTNTPAKNVTFLLEKVERSDIKEQNDIKINKAIHALVNDRAKENIKDSKIVGFISITAVVLGVALFHLQSKATNN